MNNINEYMKNATLVFDGSMGTYFASTAKNPLAKCELANTTQPDKVLAIHKEYVNAGCTAIKTNTFGANEATLEGDFALVTKVITAGYHLATQAAPNAFVFADIGPIPQGDDHCQYEEYKKIVDVFLDLGATCFLFETFSSGTHLKELSAYIKKQCPHGFIIVSFAVSPEGYTREGILGSLLLMQMDDIPFIDGVGFNCMSGPHHLLQYMKTLPKIQKHLSIMPNAGYPTVMNNRTFFGNNAGYFATQMAEIAKSGANIVGGCCGTTPLFMEKTACELRSISNRTYSLPPFFTPKEEPSPQPVNRFLEKVKAKKRVIAVELDPPLSADVSFFMAGAKALKEAGVDLITIADCPIARARMDSSLLACKLKRELDIDPLPHMTCRDRNMNATKALLLGLHMEGVHNVLIVTGDPIPSAERSEVKSVFNFNARMLAKHISTLNENTFPSPFHIAGALNVNAVNFDIQLRMAMEKVENGVTTFLTQPVLTKKAVQNLKKAHETLNANILGGIIPIVSHRNACFMNSEISGIVVSDEMIGLYEGKDKEECDRLAVSVSSSIAKEIAPFVDGYYLITPFKRVDLICEIIKNIKNLTP